MTPPARGTRRRRLGACALVGLACLIGLGVSAADDHRRQPPWRGLHLSEALDRLQRLGLHIIYSTDLVRADMFVSAEPHSADPASQLDELLAPHGLQSQPGPGGIRMVVEGPRRGSLEGTVRRAGSHTLLQDIRLQIDGAATARSDAKGQFVIQGLSEGPHSITAEAPGFAAGRLDGIKVAAGATTRVVIDLGPRHAAVEQVEVSAQEAPDVSRGALFGGELGSEQIYNSPEVTPDAILSAARLPGIVAGESSSGLTVRGGADDETLILLDGLELYDPFHVQERGGLSAIVDPGALSGVHFIGGAFPAEYGGRMSGVLEMESATPDTGPLYSVALRSDGWGLTSRGSFLDAGHWLVSARHSDFSRVLEGMGADPTYDPELYDAFAKIDYQLTPSSRIQFDALRASDLVSGEDGEFIKTELQPGRVRSNHVSSYLWVGLDTTWSTRLVSQTVLSYGFLSSVRDGSSPQVTSVDDDRQTRVAGLKQDWVFESGPHLVKWGGDVKLLAADYNYRAVPTVGVPTDIVMSPSGQDLGVYVSDAFRASQKLTIQAGLRLDKQTYTATSNGMVSPRLGLHYQLLPGTTLRAGYGYCDQPEKIYELQVQDGVTDFAATQRSKQLLLGLDQRLPAQMAFHIDIYDKLMTQLRPRYENLYDTGGFFPEADFDRVLIEPESARARGIELQLERPTAGLLSWGASYTLASVEDQTSDGWVARSWDQRHAVELSLGLRPAPGWAVSFAGSYHSGRPTTPLTATQQPLPGGGIQYIPMPGPRNSERLPDYQRLDMRVSKEFSMKGTHLRAYAGVTNLLARQNVSGVDSFHFQALPGGGVDVDPQYRSGLPRLLNFGLEWEF